MSHSSDTKPREDFSALDAIFRRLDNGGFARWNPAFAKSLEERFDVAGYVAVLDDAPSDVLPGSVFADCWGSTTPRPPGCENRDGAYSVLQRTRKELVVTWLLWYLRLPTLNRAVDSQTAGCSAFDPAVADWVIDRFRIRANRGFYERRWLQLSRLRYVGSQSKVVNREAVDRMRA